LGNTIRHWEGNSARTREPRQPSSWLSCSIALPTVATATLRPQIR
jgi:hypothetical protein